jgi:acyl carrier protein
MTEAEIKDAIFRSLRTVAPEADPASLAPTENVRAALDIDSYDFLNFLIGLSEPLGVEVPEADYGKLATLDDMLRYFAAHAGQPRQRQHEP